MHKAAIILALLLALSGCHRADEVRDISHQRVTRIQTELRSPLGRECRCYTSPEKIGRILHSLRRLGSKSRATPPRASQEQLCIRLFCADGSRKTYRLLDGVYFQSGSGPCQLLGPSKGAALLEALTQLPGDETPFFLLPPLPGRRTFSPPPGHWKIPYK